MARPLRCRRPRRSGGPLESPPPVAGAQFAGGARRGDRAASLSAPRRRLDRPQGRPGAVDGAEDPHRGGPRALGPRRPRHQTGAGALSARKGRWTRPRGHQEAARHPPRRRLARPRARPGPTPGAKAGYRYLHTALDDRSRVAYSEILNDEQAITAAAFYQRAHAWFSARGVVVERVLTDNGPCYRSRRWTETLASRGVAARYTRPYRPQTNGKVERFHRILLEEWAYIRPWTSEEQRHAAYQGFLHYHNHHRAHGALNWAAPASTLKDNVPGLNL